MPVEKWDIHVLSLRTFFLPDLPANAYFKVLSFYQLGSPG
jgi:hypothetical protein